MQIKFLFSFLVFCGFHFIAFAQKPPASISYIRGKVTDKNTGQNLAKATLELLDNKKVVKKVESFEDGTYVINEIPAGVYTLQCRAANHITQRIEGMQIKNKDEKLSYFRLRQGDEKSAPEIIATYATIQAKLNTQVSSASLYATSLFDAPANIYIYDKKDIEERGFMTLIDLLETVPEIEIQERGSYDYRNLITLRGIQGSGHFVLLLNGVRINSPTGSDGIIDKNISVRYAAQVEVILGTTSAIYGGDAVSGVINIISDKSNSSFIQATGSFGAFGTTDNAIHGAYTKGDLSISGTASYYQTKDPYLPKYYSSDFDWYNNQYLKDGSVLTWSDLVIDTSKSNTAILQFDTIQMDTIEKYNTERKAYFIQGQIKYKNFELGYQRNQEIFNASFPLRSEFVLYNKANRQGQLNSNFYIRQNWFVLDSQLQFSTVLNYSHQAPVRNITQLSTNSGYYPTYSAGYDNNFEARQQISYQRNKNHAFYGNLVFILSNSLGLINNLERPLDLRQTTAEQNLYYANTGILGDTLVQETYFVDRTSISGNIQYEGNLSKKIAFGAGLRYDDVVTSSNFRSRQSGFNIKAHLIWRLNDKWRLKFILRTTFLPPSIQKSFYHSYSYEPQFDSARNFQNYRLFYARVINPNLVAEDGIMMDVMASRASNNWQVSVNGFIQVLTNQVSNSYRVNSSYNNYEALVVEVPTNDAQSAITGLTAQIEYRPVINQEKNFELKFNASNSFMVGGLILNNNNNLSAEATTAVPYTSLQTIKAGAVLRYGSLSVFTHFLARFRSFNQPIPNVTVRGYSAPSLLVNLFAKYRLLDKNNKLDVFVNVRNLLNTRYHHVAESAAFYTALVPQDPIRISAGLSVVFGK